MKPPHLSWAEKQGLLIDAPQSQTATESTLTAWYNYFRKDGKVYKQLQCRISGGMEPIQFAPSELPQLRLISDKALNLLNQEAWNERTISEPLPTKIQNNVGI